MNHPFTSCHLLLSSPYAGRASHQEYTELNSHFPNEDAPIPSIRLMFGIGFNKLYYKVNVLENIGHIFLYNKKERTGNPSDPPFTLLVSGSTGHYALIFRTHISVFFE